MDANQPAVKKAVKNASKRIVKEFDVNWNDFWTASLKGVQLHDAIHFNNDLMEDIFNG